MKEGSRHRTDLHYLLVEIRIKRQIEEEVDQYRAGNSTYGWKTTFTNRLITNLEPLRSD